MFYEPPKDDHGLPYNPFKALVAPRPIGWVTTMSLKGEVNLSPYSYFNAVSGDFTQPLSATGANRAPQTGNKSAEAWLCCHLTGG